MQTCPVFFKAAFHCLSYQQQSCKSGTVIWRPWQSSLHGIPKSNTLACQLWPHCLLSLSNMWLWSNCSMAPGSNHKVEFWCVHLCVSVWEKYQLSLCCSFKEESFYFSHLDLTFLWENHTFDWCTEGFCCVWKDFFVCKEGLPGPNCPRSF